MRQSIRIEGRVAESNGAKMKIERNGGGGGVGGIIQGTNQAWHSSSESPREQNSLLTQSLVEGNSMNSPSARFRQEIIIEHQLIKQRKTSFARVRLSGGNSTSRSREALGPIIHSFSPLPAPFSLTPTSLEVASLKKKALKDKQRDDSTAAFDVKKGKIEESPQLTSESSLFIQAAALDTRRSPKMLGRDLPKLHSQGVDISDYNSSVNTLEKDALRGEGCSPLVEFIPKTFEGYVGLGGLSNFGGLSGWGDRSLKSRALDY
jgi:hypothetical protein